jgi:hypothetical protein
MKVLLLAAAVILIAVGDAVAAPGDPVILRGALAWPPSLGSEPFAVVRGDDGRFYYADLATALRRSPGALGAGDRLSAIGVEGRRPYELIATAVGRGDEALASVPPETTVPPPSASPVTEPRVTPVSPPAPTPSAAGPPSESWERIDGTIRKVTGKMLTLHTPEDRDVTVELGPMAGAVTDALRPGAPVTVFAVTEGGRFVVRGIVQVEAPPSALPRRR